jgi:opacity protein-like surface antigen
MKKLNLSLAAIFAMGTFAVAGGDIAPVEPVVEEPVVVASTGNFYLGLAYGALDAETELTTNIVGGGSFTDTVIDDSFSEIMIQAGYNFNEYIAIEGRYWFGMDETLNFSAWNPVLTNHDTTIDAWGIYVKPQYPVTEAFKIYALLGYGAADLSIDNVNNTGLDYVSDSVDGFSWGLGASYAFTENVSVFVDYVSIYDDDTNYPALGSLIGVESYDVDDSINTWNFGVTYNF